MTAIRLRGRCNCSLKVGGFNPREGLINMKSKISNFVERFLPQIGEFTWHTFTGSDHIISKTEKFYKLVGRVLDDNFAGKRISILEISPSKNYIGYLISDNYNASVTLLDMSEQALNDGAHLAKENGSISTVRKVCCDFHSLPFNDMEFDFVYMSGAIHHCKNPTLIFNEVARILKPSGFFHLINEPCRRELSLYKFNCNRAGGGSGLTKFEDFLLNSGMLGFFSYPTEGGRPEDLFNMTENWSIPISQFTEGQAAFFDVIEEEYLSMPLTPYEQELISGNVANHDKLAASIASHMQEQCTAASVYLGEKEKLMGFCLPSSEEVTDLSLKIARSISGNNGLLTGGKDTSYNKFITSLFGGSVTFLYKRNSRQCSNQKQLNVPVALQPSGVYVVPITDGHFSMDFSAQKLPSIQNDDFANLKSLFDPQYWEMVTESDGIIKSFLNISSISHIAFADRYENIILCIRYYAIEREDPYTISLSLGDNLLCTHHIVRSETRCYVGGFDTMEGTLRFTLKDDQGNLIDCSGYLRIGVLQILQLNKCG